MSPRGAIASGWKLGADGGGAPGAVVELTVSLPVGVQRATVVVPKPFSKLASTEDYAAAAAASVTEGGVEVWDGKKLVSPHPPGITAAEDVGDGIAFEVSNGAFHFVSTRQ